jgi:hypothetical protein
MPRPAPSQSTTTEASCLQAQQAFCIEMRDLFPIELADRQLVQEVHRGHVRLERPVVGKEDVVGPKREQRTYERRLEPVVACCDHQVVLKVLQGRFCRPRRLASRKV